MKSFSSRFPVYFFVFFLLVFYSFFNPDVGRDYSNYLRIVEWIHKGVYFREPGFSIVVLGLGKFGFTPESIIFTFRVLCFFLLMRFFYYCQSPYLGLFFFCLVPNVAIGVFNALQTWLSIAVFLQSFVINKKVHLNIGFRRAVVFAGLAATFHLAGFFWLLVVFLSRFLMKMKPYHSLILSLILPVFAVMVSDYFVSALSYSKYYSAEQVVGLKSFVFWVFLSVLLSLQSLMERKKELVVIFKSINIVYASAFISLYFLEFDESVFMRLSNYILPFAFLSLFSLACKFRFQERFVFLAIVLIVTSFNFGYTVYNLNDDMLNFKQLAVLFP